MALREVVACEKCGNTAFDLTKYRSMMLVSHDKALFTLSCPRCGATVSALCPIPEALRQRVREGAAEVHAGMGEDL